MKTPRDWAPFPTKAAPPTKTPAGKRGTVPHPPLATRFRRRLRKPALLLSLPLLALIVTVAGIHAYHAHRLARIAAWYEDRFNAIQVTPPEESYPPVEIPEEASQWIIHLAFPDSFEHYTDKNSSDVRADARRIIALAEPFIGDLEARVAEWPREESAMSPETATHFNMRAGGSGPAAAAHYVLTVRIYEHVLTEDAEAIVRDVETWGLLVRRWAREGNLTHVYRVAGHQARMYADLRAILPRVAFSDGQLVRLQRVIEAIPHVEVLADPLVLFIHAFHEPHPKTHRWLTMTNPDTYVLVDGLSGGSPDRGAIAPSSLALSRILDWTTETIGDPKSWPKSAERLYIRSALWTLDALNYNAMAETYLLETLRDYVDAIELGRSGAHAGEMRRASQRIDQRLAQDDSLASTYVNQTIDLYLNMVRGAIQYAGQDEHILTDIALARYRLAHGAYPDALDALVPEYLDHVPPYINEEWRYATEEDAYHFTPAEGASFPYYSPAFRSAK